jgi:hypothetical protein
LFFVVLIIALGLAGFAAYNAFYDQGKDIQSGTVAQPDKKLIDTVDSTVIPTNKPLKVILANKPIKKAKGKLKKNVNTPFLNAGYKPKKKLAPDSAASTGKHQPRSGNVYTIINTAFFYNAPDKNSRSNIYLTAGDAKLALMDETNDFRYVIFTNDKGQTTKGWLLKKDFIPVSDY